MMMRMAKTMAIAMMTTTTTMLMLMIINDIYDAKQFNIGIKPLNVTKTPRYNPEKHH